MSYDAQNEIERLDKLVDTLETENLELRRLISKMSAAIKAMAEELNWDYKDLLKEADEKLDSPF
jgi:division protein CdvB (Snf7/Vps24/ESCRT-III family)